MGPKIAGLKNYPSMHSSIKKATNQILITIMMNDLIYFSIFSFINSHIYKVTSCSRII